MNGIDTGSGLKGIIIGCFYIVEYKLKTSNNIYYGYSYRKTDNTWGEIFPSYKGFKNFKDPSKIDYGFASQGLDLLQYMKPVVLPNTSYSEKFTVRSIVKQKYQKGYILTEKDLLPSSIIESTPVPTPKIDIEWIN